jgi:hypothetical protein
MGFRGPRWRRSVCGSFAGQEPLRTGTAQYSKSSTVGRSLMGCGGGEWGWWKMEVKERWDSRKSPKTLELVRRPGVR